MTTITVCTTCRNAVNRDTQKGAPTGEDFLDLVRERAEGSGIAVRGVACLMGCNHGCNVAISDTGKMTYVLGRFDGTEADAAALTDYARQHATSASGTVPFRQWPQGVKGHFVARVPPLD
ncbi:DUF1636 family protein [Tropicimonas sediminicola]|uniref:Predicted metal-binding protein n=1 Tax=Tropicimonas sediminicola TaxID=1031541 RepID=A0A239EW52_9RHOB|nr:DUF1636 domain-containing protein [Tropicimonas sediminicola]SNS48906.1 Predicted metal-binding protein [Tropicimonas sediminicola]